MFFPAPRSSFWNGTFVTARKHRLTNLFLFSTLAELDPTREQALNSINFVWNTVTAMWEERFCKLSDWKRIHGHCAVPIAQGELGTWVSKQRQLRKRGKLSKEKVDALDSLNFTWSTAEADWEDKFKRLCEWTRENGHASVPFNEGELGWWVNTQRQCKRKGKLSPAREARLQSLGFVWNPSNSRSRTTSTTATTFMSSVDTTPASTPEKFENTTSEMDTNDILQLFTETKEVPNYFNESPSPLTVEQVPNTLVTPQISHVEPLSSPPAASLALSLWSPTMLSSPPLNACSMQNFPLPISPNLQTVMSGPQTFEIAQNEQSHSDALEQLLSHNDGVLLDQIPIDSLTCDEDL